MSIYAKLSKVQAELKAPKSQVNKFGGYNYRSCEDILEAVKPLLAKNELTLVLSDDVVQLGDRFYVKATAKIYDLTSDCEPIVVSAMAREEEIKKGMDGSQITGASSSYARKYALNGLFNIDDQKDSDATNTHGKETKIKEDRTTKEIKEDRTTNEESAMQLSSYPETITDEQKAEMKKLGVNIPNVLQLLNLPDIDTMSELQAHQIIEKKKQYLEKAKQQEANK